MASFHLSLKSGKPGRAAEHSRYICRTGKHARDDATDLVFTEFGNMPPGCSDNPQRFWSSADKYERVNGAAYREFEVALPAELSRGAQTELVRTFVAQEIGPKPYQWAIHEPKASIGGVPQAHAHVMFSDRKPDGVDRSLEQLFRRFNPEHPEMGGRKKDSGGRDRTALRQELTAIRARFAGLQNAFLDASGSTVRVDHRSHVDRGMAREPERHLGRIRVQHMSDEDKARLAEKRRSAGAVHA